MLEMLEMLEMLACMMEQTNARIHECMNEWMNETNEIEDGRIDWRESIERGGW